MNRRASAALLALLALGSGCARGAASARQPATRAVEAYLDAVRDDDPRRAYAMLAESVRDEVSYDAFALRWRELAAERRAQALALTGGLRGDGDLGERARVTFGDGTAATLRREGGAWRVEAGLLSTTHAASPHVAIELFADALAEKSYDDVMRVLTARRRDGIARQVDDFVVSLKKQLASARHRIDFAGKDKAELVWDDGELHYRVVLVREGEEWRVDDVHVQPVPAASPDFVGGPQLCGCPAV